MTANLINKKIAFLTSTSGVERVELTTPWADLGRAGATTTLVAPEAGTVQLFDNDVEKSDTAEAEFAVADVSADDYDALVIPGGTTNADSLRMNTEAVAFVRAFIAAGKPVAAICHGPWMLIEADVLQGKTLTSYPSLQTDVRNAGGSWVDEEVFACPAEGWTLVTSRDPGDLPAFVDAAAAAFAG